MAEGMDEIPEGVTLNTAPKNNFSFLKEAQPSRPVFSPGQRLAGEIQQLGGFARVVGIPRTQEYSPFSEVVINNEHPNLEEPLVRVYRGITQPEAAIVYNQAAYALRVRNEAGEVVVVEAAKSIVKALTESPTYINLRAYYDFMQDYADPKTKQDMAHEFEEVEEAVLAGRSVRSELLHRQIWFNGGTADTGIAPYVAVSWKPEEALDYARSNGALLVIDLPVSELEPHRGDENGETSIKGWIDAPRITAIIPYNSVPREGKDQGQIREALEVVNQSVSKNIASGELAQQKVRETFEQRQIQDKEQWPEDVAAVRQKRVAELRQLFPDMKIDLVEVEQQAQITGIDIYSFAKKKILDQIDSQMEEIGYPDFVKGMQSYNMEYKAKDGFNRKIKWDKLTNDMLVEIKANADRLLKRNQELKTG